MTIPIYILIQSRMNLQPLKLAVSHPAFIFLRTIGYLPLVSTSQEEQIKQVSGFPNISKLLSIPNLPCPEVLERNAFIKYEPNK